MTTLKPSRLMRVRAPAAVLLLTFGLAACGTIQDQFGLTKKPPDEFTVVRKAPLVLPPDFNLRPPVPGAPDSIAPGAAQVARRALSGGSERPAAAKTTRGEQALLRQAGTSQADSDIRRVLLAETSQIADKDQSLVDRLIFWVPFGDDDDAGDQVVDPAKEARRLREASLSGGNTDLGGETPTIRRRGRSLLGSFF